MPSQPRLTQSLNLPTITPVCGKVRHYERTEADAALIDLKAKGEAKGKQGEPHVYRCRVCEAWHVGHTRVSADQSTRVDATA